MIDGKGEKDFVLLARYGREKLMYCVLYHRVCSESKSHGSNSIIHSQDEKVYYCVSRKTAIDFMEYMYTYILNKYKSKYTCEVYSNFDVSDLKSEINISFIKDINCSDNTKSNHNYKMSILKMTPIDPNTVKFKKGR